MNSTFEGLYSNGYEECGYCRRFIRRNILAVKEISDGVVTFRHQSCMENWLKIKKVTTEGGARLDPSQFTVSLMIRPEEIEQLRMMIIRHNEDPM